MLRNISTTELTELLLIFYNLYLRTVSGSACEPSSKLALRSAGALTARSMLSRMRAPVRPSNDPRSLSKLREQHIREQIPLIVKASGHGLNDAGCGAANYAAATA